MPGGGRLEPTEQAEEDTAMVGRVRSKWHGLTAQSLGYWRIQRVIPCAVSQVRLRLIPSLSSIEGE